MVERLLKVVVISALGGWLLIVVWGLCSGVSVIKSPTEAIIFASTLIIPSLSLLVAYQAWYSGAKTELLKRQMQDYAEMANEITDIMDQFREFFKDLPELKREEVKTRSMQCSKVIGVAVSTVARRIFVPQAVLIPFISALDVSNRELMKALVAYTENAAVSPYPLGKDSDFYKCYIEFWVNATRLSLVDLTQKEIQAIVKYKVNEGDLLKNWNRIRDETKHIFER